MRRRTNSAITLFALNLGCNFSFPYTPMMKSNVSQTAYVFLASNAAIIVNVMPNCLVASKTTSARQYFGTRSHREYVFGHRGKPLLSALSPPALMP